MTELNNQTTIKIIYTSDLHGNARPINYGTNEKAELGLAKYATIAKKLREKNPDTIVIDNGDLIQGTPFMMNYVKEHPDKKNPMISMMNEIGLDAAVIGNHEFNFGKEILMDAIQTSDFPWLSANILDEQTNQPYFGPPYIIKTLTNGVKVAILGVTTHYIPNWEKAEHIQGIQFTDAYATLEYWVDKIRSTEKCDLLIVAYHGGFERDLATGEPTERLTGENQGYEMASRIKGIDVLLTGHQHRVLTGEIQDCLVIQPGNNGQFYGEVDLELTSDSNEWKLTNQEAKVKSLEGFEADPQLMAMTEPFEQSTQLWLDQPIGQVQGDMTITDSFQARIQKHPFIEFIQQVQLDVSGVDISVTSLLSNESQGFSSTITMRDIVSNYIFPNTLEVLELSGHDIKEALEKTAAYFIVNSERYLAVNPEYEYPKPQHFNYDMWEGIEYTIRVSNPIGRRVENVTYQGTPLDLEKNYHVVMNNYRASGGGDFHMFSGKPVVKEIQQDMVELISSYIEKHQTIHPTLTNNFTVIV